jgi:hypothetical protein
MTPYTATQFMTSPAFVKIAFEDAIKLVAKTNNQTVELTQKAFEMEMLTEVCQEFYTKSLLRASPNKVFVFGDNLIQKGKGGQAIIRCEPNAFGVPTKHLPTMNINAFFSDKEDERQAVLMALRKLYVISKTNIIVFPSSGIGTGLACMAEKSPKLFAEMNGVLKEFFMFDNKC